MSDIPGPSADLLFQLRRLGGRIPEDVPAATEAPTPAGPHALPAALRVLLAVEWPARHILLTKDGGVFHEAHLPDARETPAELLKPVRHWHTIGHDDSGHELVVDLAEADGTADPWTYRVERTGGKRPPKPKRLSERLARFTAKPAPAERHRLARACAYGDLAAVREDLAAGAPVGRLDDLGYTPLHLAALCGGSPEIVSALLDAGADVHATVASLQPALALIVGDERLRGLRLRTGGTPLHGAAWSTHPFFTRHLPRGTEVVALLLAAGADPERPDSVGRTPLEIAGGIPGPQAAEAARLMRETVAPST
ncbi:ankyrin repeat domain-containing protein [Phytomonospora endophytica]|uniref:Ankyrin repeat domain-containing protein n=1 Tax=Phytomonospora endophytica TaxID=714109 RepID=A0A841FXN6_9ACTN|nr:ankyrin repeat domain-containing protein [Phytomonospora endophytica]MBB6037229.1 hypothetical protein [Phytomonospora endophytica]GIG71269.1 hypothetical protein Pen01_75640 [Phytomonospora endophytica]